METAGIVEIMEIASNNHQNRRRRDCFITLTMQRSDVRSIILLDMIRKSAKCFWIKRRCDHQQYRWPKNLVEASIVEPIPIMRIRWGNQCDLWR
jgi:hypothetical protein